MKVKELLEILKNADNPDAIIYVGVTNRVNKSAFTLASKSIETTFGGEIFVIFGEIYHPETEE